MAEVLRQVLGRLLGLDKDDNLILGGTKLIVGHSSKLDQVIDLLSLSAANSSIPNAVGDGVTDDSAALAAAVTDASGSGGTLQITVPLLINANQTIPSNVQLAFIGRGQIKPGSGKTFTINGPINAGPWQIFDTSLGGTIAGTPHVPTIYDAWFGTDPTNTIDSASAFNAAFAFAHGAGDLPVYSLAGTFKLGSTVTINGTGAGTSTHPNWIGAVSRKTILSYAGVDIAVRFKGGSGLLTHGYVKDLSFVGDANSIAVKFAGQCGSKLINCKFDTNYIGVQWNNEGAGQFTEFCVASGCEFTVNCQIPGDYTVGAGNNSFHGSGFTDACTINQSGCSNVTFTGVFAGTEQNGTLSANWTKPSGQYSILFSSGEVRSGTFTINATNVTWTGSALTLPATASVSVASCILRIGAGSNVYNAPFSAHIWMLGSAGVGYYTIFQNNVTGNPKNPSFSGELSLEAVSGDTIYIGDPNGNNTYFAQSPVRATGINNGTGANILPGAFMRVDTVGVSFDSTVGFTGGKYSQFLAVTPTIKVSSPLSKTHRLADVEVNISTSYYYHYTLDLTYINTGSTSVAPKKLDCFDTVSGSAPYTLTGARFTSDTNSLGAPTLTGNTDGTFNIIPPTLAVTFTGAPTGTSATLNANWTKPNGTYPIAFSDAEVRNAVLTNGATTCDWSADSRGALTGSPTTSATASLWPVTGISVYVHEVQQSAGVNGSSHHLF